MTATLESTHDNCQPCATRGERTRNERRFSPHVDILERPDELTVVADMPGVTGSDIDVQFENRTLTIHGRVAPRPDAKTRFLIREYGIGDFVRTFQVSEAIDAARISAEFADGVLTLRLPKAEAVRPRKISVTSGR